MFAVHGATLLEFAPKCGKSWQQSKSQLFLGETSAKPSKSSAQLETVRDPIRSYLGCEEVAGIHAPLGLFPLSESRPWKTTSPFAPNDAS
jgi:hypothetical protein